MKRLLILLLVFVLFFFACSHGHDDDGTSSSTTDCPAEIAERAFSFAELYAASDTEYSWGGQDSLRTIQIDCSGLVVMCYKYALVDTEFSLLANDMTSAFMSEKASRKISADKARKGDLIFMGETGTEEISHIALFEKLEDGRIYFIDSTQKDAQDGSAAINGVTSRFYEQDDERFKSFGIMKLVK